MIVFGIIGVLCLIFGLTETALGLLINGICFIVLTFGLLIWLLISSISPLEVESVEYYTPVLVTFDNGTKAQVIMVEKATINITMIFHVMIPENKIVKRTIWKKNYCGITYVINPKISLVDKSEKNENYVIKSERNEK